MWLSFQTLRKAKRAPVTDLVILMQRKEAVKAGISLEEALTFCCEAGWQSFNAEWWEQRQQGKPAAGQRPQPESFREREQRLARDRYEEMVGRKPAQGSIIDVTSNQLEIGHEPSDQSH